MLRNYLTITSRIIRRHKMFSFINIAGLAAGIACCLLISIWVRAERSTDRFHEKIDRIFLVRSQFRSGQEVNSQSGTPPLLGPALAAVISALGLAGLSAFMVEGRVREIGIRKVLGASALRVTGYLTANVLKWVLAADLIAWPAGYLIMSRWLRSFAFRIDLEPWIFPLSGGILLALGLGTVAFQTLGAARADPVESLRHE